MPLGAGDLEFRVDLIKKQDGSNRTDGSTDVNYQIIESRWADSKPIGNRQGHQVLSTRNLGETPTHDFWIRHEDQFDNRGKIDHIQFRGRLYEIMNTVTERERDLLLKLEARLLNDPVTPFNIVDKP